LSLADNGRDGNTPASLPPRMRKDARSLSRTFLIQSPWSGGRSARTIFSAPTINANARATARSLVRGGIQDGRFGRATCFLPPKDSRRRKRARAAEGVLRNDARDRSATRFNGRAGCLGTRTPEPPSTATTRLCAAESISQPRLRQTRTNRSSISSQPAKRRPRCGSARRAA